MKRTVPPLEPSEATAAVDEQPAVCTSDQPSLMTPDEGAEYLRITKDRFYDMVRKGMLPGVVRLGRQIRIRRDMLDSFCESGGHPLDERWRRDAR